MFCLKLLPAGLAAAVAALIAGSGYAEEFSARLNGFNEIGPLSGPTGAILTDATGTVRLDLDKEATPPKIAYTLTYTAGFTSPVTVAHIHFGKVHVAGGVIAFFCGGGGKPACPNPSGSVSGVITGSDVVGPTAQNVTPGDFDALEDALTSNTAYANVHTMKFPAGEIRGQVRKVDREDRED